MSRQASVDDLIYGVDGALGMNQHADVIRRYIEETSGFDNLESVSISVAESIVMCSSTLQMGALSGRFTAIWKN